MITGSGGQLGRELVEVLADHDVLGGEPPALDVTDREQVLAVVTQAEPDAIVHAAAWTDVDGCEGDSDRAFRVNALGTRHIAAGARVVGARVCYVSTDYVFDGTSGRSYTEWDATNPISVYGRTKLAGEGELGPGDTVVRTSWLCGRHGRNFVRTVLERAAGGQELRVVDDQHGCFTLASDLALMIRRLVLEGRPGVHHVTNQGPTTWHGLACEALVAAGFDPAGVKAISTADMHPLRPAPRPRYSVLDNAALRLSGTELLPDRHDALARLVAGLGFGEKRSTAPATAAGITS